MDTNNDSKATTFPDPDRSPFAARVLLTLLGRGSVKPMDVDMDRRVPQFIAAIHELRAHGFRVAPKLVRHKPASNGTLVLCDPSGVRVDALLLDGGLAAREWWARVQASPACEAWTHRVCAEITRQDG
ncbi:hypothetical protein [Dokdonella sp.]|uniref:hypothetical protein n=1 Tax=Dokdonella sp. TaxID=2291710 RepID=UPI003784E7D2